MIRSRNGAAGQARGEGRTPRRTGRQPAPNRLAFSSNAVRAAERDIQLRQQGIETSPFGGGKGLRPQKPTPKSFRAVGYIRVSTDEQGESGLGLAAQRRTIEDEAARRGWTLTAIRQDVASGKTTDNRPALAACLADLDSGHAEVLVVAKLDRLSRSLLDFAGLMDTFRRKGWAFAALDLGVDTSTPSGELMAGVLALFAQHERRLIGQRTKDALAVLKRNGVKLGRPRTLDPRTAAAIHRQRAAGATLQAIADKTGLARSTVQGVLDREVR